MYILNFYIILAIQCSNQPRADQKSIPIHIQ